MQQLFDKLPAEIKLVLILYPNQCVLAGGAVLDLIEGRTPKDWDLFFTTESSVYKSGYKDVYLGSYNLTETGNAITLRGPNEIQIIKRDPKTTIEDVINSFDFSVVQQGIYYDGTEFKYIASEACKKDLGTGYTAYMNPIRDQDDLAMLFRMNKLAYKGYKTTQEDIVRILERYVQGCPADITVREYIPQSFKTYKRHGGY